MTELKTKPMTVALQCERITAHYVIFSNPGTFVDERDARAVSVGSKL